MATETNYICDMCGIYKSTNIDDFRILTIKKKAKNEEITLCLCEEKCFKLYKMVWKVLDKIDLTWNFSKINTIMEKVIKDIELESQL